MKKAKIIIMLLLTLSQIINEVQSGTACYGFCLGICLGMGAIAFGKRYGIPLDVTGCQTMCMAACSWGVLNPPACFSEETKIYVIENNQTIRKNISEIKRNDFVLTLINNMKKKTKVISNERIEGNFEFYKIILENKSNIKVTGNHGIIVKNKKENGVKIMFAKNVKEGDILYTLSGEFRIIEIKKEVQNQKYTLVTEDGTVLASDIYISLICENMIDENSNFKNIMDSWRDLHGYNN